MIAEFGKLFRVDSVLDLSEGSYACRFEPVSDSAAFAGLFLSADVELSVRPTAVLSNHNSNIQGDLLQLKFYSAYKVKTYATLQRGSEHRYLIEVDCF